MPELQPYMPYIIGGAVLLALLLAAWILARLFRGRTRGRRGTRLGIVEYHEIDQTRRLVLLRRDDVEHLVLIGGNQDVVVESNIGGNSFEEMQTPAMEEPAPLRAPRPPVFGARPIPLRPVAPAGNNE